MNYSLLLNPKIVIPAEKNPCSQTEILDTLSLVSDIQSSFRLNRKGQDSCYRKLQFAKTAIALLLKKNWGQEPAFLIF
jgi:hypothetical protein